MTTKLLAQAMAAARNLPAGAQDEFALVLLQLIGLEDEAPVRLTAEEKAAIGRSRIAADRGEFATDDEVRAVWAEHGLRHS